MKKISKLFIAIGVVLILSALGMLVKNQYDDYVAGKECEKVLDIIENLEISEEETNTEENKIVMIEGYGYIGTITIPTLDIKLPIMSEFDYKRLRRSPCLYYGSFNTNDLVICAHRLSKHFAKIEKLSPKDIIVITDMNGNNYYYEVTLIEMLKDTNIKEMLNNEFDLTLFTCSQDGTARVTVRCTKLDTI